MIGAGFSEQLIAPEALALDTLMVAFFATVLVGLARERSALWPWLTAAVVALAAIEFLPPGWHILAGGLSGGLVGALLHGR